MGAPPINQDHFAQAYAWSRVWPRVFFYSRHVHRSFISWRSFVNDLYSSDVSKISIHIWASPLGVFCFQDVDHFYRVFSTTAGSSGNVVLAFPSEPGAELPVCAGLPCARVGHRFLLWLGFDWRGGRILELVGEGLLRCYVWLILVVCLWNLEIIDNFRMFRRFLGQKGVSSINFIQCVHSSNFAEYRRAAANNWTDAIVITR